MAALDFALKIIHASIRQLFDTGIYDEESTPAPIILMGYSRGAATVVAAMGGKEKKNAHEYVLSKMLKNTSDLSNEDHENIVQSYGQKHTKEILIPNVAILLAPFGGECFELESLIDIKTPTLIFQFEEDTLSENIETTYGKMGNAILVTLPGNHLTCLDEGDGDHFLTRDPKNIHRGNVHESIRKEISIFLKNIKLIL